MLGSARPGAHEPGISLIVKDADAVYQRATAAGAKLVEEIGDKPYGDEGSPAVTSKARSSTS